MRRKFVRPHSEEDASQFLGRDAEIIFICEQLAAHKRILRLVGKQGVGKTSLVRARVIPRLRDSSWQIWEICPANDLLSTFWETVQVGIPKPQDASLAFQIALNSLSSSYEKNIVIWDHIGGCFSHLSTNDKQGFLETLIKSLVIHPNISHIFVTEVEDGSQVFELNHLSENNSDTASLTLNPPKIDDLYAIIGHEFARSPFAISEELLITLTTDLIGFPGYNTIFVPILQTVMETNHDPTLETFTTVEYENLGKVGGILTNYLDLILNRQVQIDQVLARGILTNMISRRGESVVFSAELFSSQNHPETNNTGAASPKLEETFMALLDLGIITETGAQIYELSHSCLADPIAKWNVENSIDEIIRLGQKKALPPDEHIVLQDSLEAVSDFFEQLIDGGEQILTLDPNSEYREQQIDRWLNVVESDDVQPLFRTWLLQALWEERCIERVLKALRLLKDEKLVGNLTKSVMGGEIGGFVSLPNIRDRKQQLSLVALTFISNAEAIKFLTEMAPSGMAYVPPGEFLMGSDKDQMAEESPEHWIWLPGFYMRRHVSSMADYRRFLLEGGYEIELFWTNAGWKWRQESIHIAEVRWQMLTRVPTDDYPVNWINWYEAMAFACWSGASLATEAQWEKAARGVDGRVFPWGNEFDEHLCSTDALGLDGPTKPGSYSPHGDSPYGLADMAGNLLEWVTSLYMPYPYNEDDGREDQDAPGRRVHRGGAWSNPPYVATTYRRVPNYPHEIHVDHGIRLVYAPYRRYLKSV